MSAPNPSDPNYRISVSPGKRPGWRAVLACSFPYVVHAFDCGREFPRTVGVAATLRGARHLVARDRKIARFDYEEIEIL